VLDEAASELFGVLEFVVTELLKARGPQAVRDKSDAAARTKGNLFFNIKESFAYYLINIVHELTN
jgi:hypothetical protein